MRQWRKRERGQRPYGVIDVWTGGSAGRGRIPTSGADSMSGNFGPIFPIKETAKPRFLGGIARLPNIIDEERWRCHAIRNRWEQ